MAYRLTAHLAQLSPNGVFERSTAYTDLDQLAIETARLRGNVFCRWFEVHDMDTGELIMGWRRPYHRENPSWMTYGF